MDKKKLLVRGVGLWINLLSYLYPSKAMSIALNLFSTPRNRMMNRDQEEWIATADASTINFEAKRIKIYHWKGVGQTAIFMHGWESYSARWKPYISKLIENDINVICFDAPAHGLSEGNTFTLFEYAAVAQLIVNKYKADILIGHSAGGYAASYALANHEMPSIKKAIILAPTGTLQTFTKAFFSYLKLNMKMQKGIYEAFAKKFGQQMDSLDLKYQVPKIKIPCLVVHDKHDDILPIEYTIEALKYWENGQLEITENYGHRLQAKSVYKLVQDYILENKN